MDHVVRHSSTSILSGWEKVLSEAVLGDCLFHLPRVPSPVEITEIYLWCWDKKLSIRGLGRGSAQEADYSLHPNRIRASEGSFKEMCIS